MLAFFCTTAAGAINHWPGNQAVPRAEVIDRVCSKTAADVAFLVAQICPFIFAVQGVVVAACFSIRFLEELNVLRIISVFDHLRER